MLEKQIVGSVLLDPTLYTATDGLRTEDLQHEICLDVWAALRSHIASGAEFNTDNVLGACRIASRDHISTLLRSGSKDRDRLCSAIKLLTDARRTQALNTLLTGTLGRLKGGEHWGTIVSELLSTVTTDYGGHRSRSASSVRIDSIERLKRSNREKVQTGLTCLDRHLGGGLSGGHLVGIGALTKTGKTTLVATISANLETNKVPHQVFFLERHETFIEELKEARALNVNIRDLPNHIPELEARARQRTYTEYVQARSMTVEEIRHEILYGARKNGIRVVLIDYFQLIPIPSGKGVSRLKELERAAQLLQATATDSGADIIVTCQLEDDGRPRETNAIKFAANLYMNMHRDQNHPETWFEMIATNITPANNIGSISDPAIMFCETSGPYFANPYDNF